MGLSDLKQLAAACVISPLLVALGSDSWSRVASCAGPVPSGHNVPCLVPNLPTRKYMSVEKESSSLFSIDGGGNFL